MISAVRFGNALAVIFSLITTYIGIKVVGLVSPIISGSKEEVGVLLSLPLMITPVLYTAANKFCQKTFVKNTPPKTGPSRVFSALVVASALAISLQLISFIFGFVHAFLQMLNMSPDEFARANTDVMGQMLAAAPFLYISLAILAAFAGMWLVKRHTDVPADMMVLTLGVFWLISTLVNYVLMNQPGMMPNTSTDLSHPLVRVAMFIGIMVGGIIPCLWLWLWLWIGGKIQRNRLAKASPVNGGEGI